MYNVDKPILKFMMRDETGIVDNENFIKYVIPLERIKDKYYNDNKGMSELERLVSLLVINNKKELEKIKESGNEIMREAAKKIEKLREDENLIGVYDEKKQIENI